MKFNKTDFILYVYTGKLSRLLYILTSLIILIPICINLILNISFGSSFIKVSITIAYILILIGKTLIILKNKHENENISGDIGILTGILISFISFLLN